MKNIEPLVKDLLLKKKMSIDKFAVMAGLTSPTIHAIFKKNDAKVSQLEAMSAVLGVHVSYFLEDAKGSVNLLSQSIVDNQLFSTQTFLNIS